jgi:hypothetical protein
MNPEGDKITRCAAISAQFEAGSVFFPKSAPWLDSLKAELLGFPNVKYDDQVDSVTQALSWIARHRQTGAVIRLWRLATVFFCLAASCQLALAQIAGRPPDTMAARTLACAPCHGAQGQGTKHVYFPRLAGKPPPTT